MRFLCLCLLILASCDTTPGAVDGPPGLPDPDEFVAPVDSVRVVIETDKRNRGEVFVLYPGENIWSGFPVPVLPEVYPPDVRLDTTFYAVKGDSIGVWVNLTDGRWGCANAWARRIGEDEYIFVINNCDVTQKLEYKYSLRIP